MNAKRIRLLNAVRKALFQRTRVRRSIETTRANFAPTALKNRAKRRASESVQVVRQSAEETLRRYALPLGLTALAGLAFAFRRPLASAASVLADQAGRLADGLAAHFVDGDPPTPPPASMEPDDERN